MLVKRKSRTDGRTLVKYIYIYIDSEKMYACKDVEYNVFIETIDS